MKRKYYTVAMRRQTYERLKDYKVGGGTFDQVLNELMDDVPLEKVSKELLALHRQRLKTFKGRPWKEVEKSLGLD